MNRTVCLLFVVFVYNVSPVDAIPDILPLLGSLDDAVLSALGVWLAGRTAGGSPPSA